MTATQVGYGQLSKLWQIVAGSGLVLAASGGLVVLLSTQNASGITTHKEYSDGSRDMSGHLLIESGANTIYADSIGRNVGIRKTNPAAPLDVAGTASAALLQATAVNALQTIQGAGLADCQGNANKVTYDGTAKRFLCQSDQAGGTGNFGTGNVITIGNYEFVTSSTGSLKAFFNGLYFRSSTGSLKTLFDSNYFRTSTGSLKAFFDGLYFRTSTGSLRTYFNTLYQPIGGYLASSTGSLQTFFNTKYQLIGGYLASSTGSLKVLFDANYFRTSTGSLKAFFDSNYFRSSTGSLQTFLAKQFLASSTGSLAVAFNKQFLGTSTGGLMKTLDNRYVRTSGSTMTGVLVLKSSSNNNVLSQQWLTQDGREEGRLTSSGALSFSGALVNYGSVTLAGVISCTDLQTSSAGALSCNNAKYLATSTGSLQTFFNGLYLRTSTGSLQAFFGGLYFQSSTGSLRTSLYAAGQGLTKAGGLWTLNQAMTGTSLKIRGTASGYTLYGSNITIGGSQATNSFVGVTTFSGSTTIRSLRGCTRVAFPVSDPATAATTGSGNVGDIYIPPLLNKFTLSGAWIFATNSGSALSTIQIKNYTQGNYLFAGQGMSLGAKRLSSGAFLPSATPYTINAGDVLAPYVPIVSATAPKGFAVEGQFCP